VIILIDMPYFMENEEWFYFDPKKQRFVLTENATEKARKSYREYYEELERGD
jgi:hypothetical protein